MKQLQNALLDTLPVLDPRSEEVLEREAKIQAIASGVVEDILPNDPLAVLVGTQARVGAELLWYYNKLPLALLVTFLSQTGIGGRESTQAVYRQQFSLSIARPSFIVPAGYRLKAINGQVFEVIDDVVFNLDQTEAEGLVRAVEAGTAGNVPLGAIRQMPVPLSFLRATTNLEQLVVGTDADDRQQTLARQLERLRTRSPITEADYEYFATEVLGAGSEAKAIGNLGLDGATEELGAVHVYCLDPSLNPANPGLVTEVRAKLGNQVQVGTRLHVSPMPIQPIGAEVSIGLEEGASVSTVAEALWNAYQAYDRTIRAGQTIYADEIAYTLRRVPGVSYATDLSLDGLRAINPTTQFTRIRLEALVINFDLDGGIVTLGFGQGDPD